MHILNLIKTIVEENVRRRLTKDMNKEIGVSSMESESTSSGGKKGAGVGISKDSGMKIGGSSMDADLSLGGSKAKTVI